MVATPRSLQAPDRWRAARDRDRDRGRWVLWHEGRLAWCCSGAAGGAHAHGGRARDAPLPALRELRAVADAIIEDASGDVVRELVLYRERERDVGVPLSLPSASAGRSPPRSKGRCGA